MRRALRRSRAYISIHAPREGRDDPWGCRRHGPKHFNPRAPRGARLRLPNEDVCHYKFQSTRPARGATYRGYYQRATPNNFNPRAPRGARQQGTHRPRAHHTHFNPRAPRGARLNLIPAGLARQYDFNPRAPRGARLSCSFRLFFQLRFQSTRPARGATLSRTPRADWFGYFNPRAPRGARRRSRLHPLRQTHISIHAPREGRDTTAE